MSLIDSILAATLLGAPVLVLAGLGGLLHFRAGVINIALEGHILVGAFVGLAVGDRAASLAVGYLAAAAVGFAAGLITTLLTTRLGGNEIIIGLGYNTLALGSIGFILDEVYSSSGNLRPSQLPEATTVGVGPLRDWPLIGPLVAEHDLLVWALIPVAWLTAYALEGTAAGLRLRAAGADADTAGKLGVPVLAIRDMVGGAAGAAAAIGGAHLAMVVSGIFGVAISGGRGYVALAAIYLGRGRVLRTMLPLLLFLAADAAQRRFQLQWSSLPNQLIQTLPYLAVIVALVIPTIGSGARTRSATTIDRPDLVGGTSS